MFYISLILILLGILIFIYSIFLDSRKKVEQGDMVPAAGKGKPAGEKIVREKVKRVDTVFLEEDESRYVENESIGKKPTGISRPLDLDGGGVDYQDDDEVPADEATVARINEKPASEGPGVVLYEDSSGVVDYESESVSIDPSFESYKEIKRIGAGKIQIEKQGINFYRGKKLYRFDFHRIRDLKSGNKYLALFLDGSNSVRLFLFNRDYKIIASIVDEYEKYRRG